MIMVGEITGGLLVVFKDGEVVGGAANGALDCCGWGGLFGVVGGPALISLPLVGGAIPATVGGLVKVGVGTSVVTELGPLVMTELGTSVMTELGPSVKVELGTSVVTELGPLVMTELGTSVITELGVSVGAKPPSNSNPEGKMEGKAVGAVGCMEMEGEGVLGALGALVGGTTGASVTSGGGLEEGAPLGATTGATALGGLEITAVGV